MDKWNQDNMGKPAIDTTEEVKKVLTDCTLDDSQKLTEASGMESEIKKALAEPPKVKPANDATEEVRKVFTCGTLHDGIGYITKSGMGSRLKMAPTRPPTADKDKQ